VTVDINHLNKANDVMCAVLLDAANRDKNILVATSDSRGSGGMHSFFSAYPDQTVEIGIAEQNLVAVCAGLARSGKRPFAISPSSFLTMRSIEQIKDDVSYSLTNVKLIGISGGNSYSNLGATHHSLQDLAIAQALPDLEVYMPCDRYQTAALFEYLTKSDRPAFVRIGKKALIDCYPGPITDFRPGHANVLRLGEHVAIIAAGETVYPALKAATLLDNQGIHAQVVDLVSVKPIDVDMITRLVSDFNQLVTVEEHSVINGLGARVASIVAEFGNTKLKILGFPDEQAISGKQDQVFHYYGIDSEGIAKTIVQLLE
jgi:transketolase